MSEPPFREGSRVKCVKEGSYNGKRGRVQDIILDVAVVEFRQSTIVEPVTCFEKV